MPARPEVAIGGSSVSPRSLRGSRRAARPAASAEKGRRLARLHRRAASNLLGKYANGHDGSDGNPVTDCLDAFDEVGHWNIKQFKGSFQMHVFLPVPQGKGRGGQEGGQGK
ncbi:hypothetical protein DPEC_G00185560 [Dallia pectoralis]|uniref:Uncharacterized protein n=1 Tax=Dallia pectoralis TaxID=75939 RepID=A0ACC2GBJ3_DALPE|nr:hypothetical protein DPEC_G00185560 [Dallia pectoralis]